MAQLTAEDFAARVRALFSRVGYKTEIDRAPVRQGVDSLRRNPGDPARSRLRRPRAMIATPIAIANLPVERRLRLVFSDRIGRRWAMIIPALFVIPLSPFYLFSDNITVIAVAFALQGVAGSGSRDGCRLLLPSGGHLGRVLCASLGLFATTWQLDLAIAMLVGTVFAAINFIVALLLALSQNVGITIVMEITNVNTQTGSSPAKVRRCTCSDYVVIRLGKSTTRPRGRARRLSQLWVMSGKTLSEYIFSELPQIADIIESASGLRTA